MRDSSLYPSARATSADVRIEDARSPHATTGRSRDRASHQRRDPADAIRGRPDVDALAGIAEAQSFAWLRRDSRYAVCSSLLRARSLRLIRQICLRRQIGCKKFHAGSR